jgi:hypothetical protein
VTTAATVWLVTVIDVLRPGCCDDALSIGVRSVPELTYVPADLAQAAQDRPIKKRNA